MIDLLEHYKKTSSEYSIVTRINNNFSKDQIMQAINSHYYGLNNLIDIKYNDDCYNFLNRITQNFEDSSYVNTIYSVLQRYISIIEWEKTKQVYVFDKDLVSELTRTNTDVILPKNVFDFLPSNSLCLDISSNMDLCNKYNCDLILVNIHKVKLKNNQEFYTIHFTIYEKEKFRHSIVLTIENCLDENSRSITDILKANGNITIKDTVVYKDEITFQNILVIQLLIYLSSIEPDIKETIESKANKASYKNKKSKKKKINKPIRTFTVGERFGEAYRTWIKSKSNQNYSINSSVEKHVKPHFRRAHWHRYWIGKKNSDERRLVLKWTHQCFCGSSSNLDIVKHKVN